MGVVWKILIVAAVALAAYKVHEFSKVPVVPTLEETWWGPRDPAKEDTSIKPFKINVPNEVLDDLKQRLSKARSFTPPLEGIQHQYGINANLLKNIVDYWKTKYDWRAREKFLNQYPQFTVSVQGLRLHYLHVKPSNTQGLKVLPLLLLHGWPGSIREFYELIPLLTTPQKGKDFVFEIFAPSLPGYGFSEAAVRPGLGAAEMAVVFKNFMKKVGHEKFYLQGGDWGAIIGQTMATLFPEQVLGAHSNMCSVNTPWSNFKLFLYSFYPSLIISKEYEDKVYPLSSMFSYLIEESGYMHLQATKPDTVGVALNDSPVGLAAYIIEKFTTWTRREWRERADGGLTEKFSYEKLLDNVMIYWVTGSITTSVRLYAETFSAAQMSLGLDRVPVEVPSSCARFANELAYTPTALLEIKYKNLVQVTDYKDGGHFAAFELPEIMANDIYSGVSKMINKK